MLDAVVEYLPSPLDIPPVKGIEPGTDKVEVRPADDDAPFSALAFKIMTDPFVGTLSFFRVYSGSLISGASVYNSTKSKRERIGRLLKMHANKREEIKEVYAGDIAAAVGLKNRDHGRHSLRRRSTDRSRIDRFSRSGDLHRHRTEEQGRSRKT